LCYYFQWAPGPLIPTIYITAELDCARPINKRFVM
jgi:hypothetical protein